MLWLPPPVTADFVYFTIFTHSLSAKTRIKKSADLQIN